MNGLEDRLINDLTDLADTAEFRSEGAAAITGTVHRRRQLRRVRQVVLVAAVGAVLGGFAARELLHDEEDISTQDNPSPTTVEIAPTTTTPPQTTVAPPVGQEVALTGDGLGRLKFGDDFDAVVATVETELGPADSLGEVAPLEDCDAEFGPCEAVWYEECSPQGLYTVQRSANWDGLTLNFRGSDADSLVLRNWAANSDAPVATPEGVRVSDPPQVWKDNYGERIRFETFQPPNWESVTLELQGTITGYAFPDAMSSMAAGYNCTQGDI